MTHRPRRLAPSLLAQVLALVFLSVLAASAVNVAIVLLVPPPPPEFYRMSEIAAVLKAGGAPVKVRSGRSLRAELLPAPKTPDDPYPSRIVFFLRHSLADKLSAPVGQVKLSMLDARTGGAPRTYRMMRSQFAPDPPPKDVSPVGGAGTPVANVEGPGQVGPDTQRQERRWRDRPPSAADAFAIVPFEASWRQADGRWWVLRVMEGGLLNEWQKRVLLGFALSILAMGPVAYLFARRFSAPVVAFAEAAERLGRNPEAPPLSLRGPKEIEAAATAFNEMQGRLNRYVVDRTEMVGAIAHDLRTPLTRLRFRVDEVPRPLRTKIEGDLDQMEAMIAAALAFVRDATRSTERVPLDLRALVESVVSDMAETGLDVTLAPGDRVLVAGDSLALRRLVSNLIDNAVKFGKRARLNLNGEDGSARLAVEDDGPGIPIHQQEEVFEPFHRGERSRSRATGGAGLGLAVVRSIARAHAGDVQLRNRLGGGLTAELLVPALPSPVQNTAVKTAELVG